MLQQLSLDYQPNLSNCDRFPFSLYHAPIRNHVLQTVREEQAQLGMISILNVGCGLSQILPRIPGRFIYHGVDIDERNILFCRERYGATNVSFDVCDPFALPLPDSSVDLAFATEVVEHVVEPERWLSELVRVVKPGGRVQLSTPNYGGFLLPFLERTFLELIARRQGFTRRGIHPTPFNRARLTKLLEQQTEAVVVKKTLFGLALVGVGRRSP